MRSVIADTYGGPEKLRVVDAEPPLPAGGQVLVRVAASSVNPLDTHELTGRPFLVRIVRGLPRPKPANRALGSDFAGVVEAVGPEVTRFRVGDRVLGFGRAAWSDLAVVREEGLVLVPEGLSLLDAGGVGVAAITALQSLRRGGLTGPASWGPGEVEPMRPRVQWLGPLMGPAGLAIASRFSRRTFASFLAKRGTDDLQRLAHWLGVGALRVVIDEVYPLDRIAEAVAHQLTDHARGKVLVSLL